MCNAPPGGLSACTHLCTILCMTLASADTALNSSRPAFIAGFADRGTSSSRTRRTSEMTATPPLPLLDLRLSRWMACKE